MATCMLKPQKRTLTEEDYDKKEKNKMKTQRTKQIP